MTDANNPASDTISEAPSDEVSRVHRLLDKALALQEPVVRRHVARLRSRRPDASPAQIVKRLNIELRTATIGTGASVGATAAVPGVGTAAALAITGGEAVVFMNAAALYVLSLAAVHGVEPQDLERRRTLVMAVMLGDLGSKTVSKVAERTGQHWAKALVKSIPNAKIRAINKVLGPHFVTKYGTKQGIIVLGRVVPFGIGAAIGGTANAIFSQILIKAADRAFGPAPNQWVGADPAHSDDESVIESPEVIEAEIVEAEIVEGDAVDESLQLPVPPDSGCESGQPVQAESDR